MFRDSNTGGFSSINFNAFDSVQKDTPGFNRRDFGFESPMTFSVPSVLSQPEMGVRVAPISLPQSFNRPAFIEVPTFTREPTTIGSLRTTLSSIPKFDDKPTQKHVSFRSGFSAQSVESIFSESRKSSKVEKAGGDTPLYRARDVVSPADQPVKLWTANQELSNKTKGVSYHASSTMKKIDAEVRSWEVSEKLTYSLFLHDGVELSVGRLLPKLKFLDPRVTFTVDYAANLFSQFEAGEQIRPLEAGYDPLFEGGYAAFLSRIHFSVVATSLVSDLYSQIITEESAQSAIRSHEARFDVAIEESTNPFVRGTLMAEQEKLTREMTAGDQIMRAPNKFKVGLRDRLFFFRSKKQVDVQEKITIRENLQKFN